MSNRTVMVVIAAFILVGMVSPMFVQGSDALGPGDYYITIPGTEAPDVPIDMTVTNGESCSYTLYVVNTSDKYLNVSFSFASDTDDLRVEGLPDAVLLDPKDTKGSLYTVTFTIAAKTVSDPHESVKVDVILTITDISDKTSTIDNHVIFNVKLVSSFDTAPMYNKFFGITPNGMPGILGNPMFTAVATVILGVVITYLVCRLMVNRLIELVDKKTSEDGANAFKKGFLCLLIIQVLVFSADVFLKIIGAEAKAVSFVDDLVYFIRVIFLTVFFWNIYIFGVKSLFNGLEKRNPNTFWDSSMIPLFNMLGTIVFLVVGISLLLVPFNLDLGQILLSAGIVSLGVSLGAQSILSQFFSGLVILITRPFKEGDYLKINDTVYIVRKVRVMYTEFKNRGRDEIVTMPNNTVASATIKNLTKEDAYCRQSVYFTVAYGTDLEYAQKVILDAIKDCDLIVSDEKHRPPYTGVSDFLSSGVAIRLGFYTRNYRTTGYAAARVREIVYNAFRANGVEIPYERIQIDILSDRTDVE